MERLSVKNIIVLSNFSHDRLNALSKWNKIIMKLTEIVAHVLSNESAFHEIISLFCNYHAICSESKKKLYKTYIIFLCITRSGVRGVWRAQYNFLQKKILIFFFPTLLGNAVNHNTPGNLPGGCVKIPGKEWVNNPNKLKAGQRKIVSNPKEIFTFFWQQRLWR